MTEAGLMTIGEVARAAGTSVQSIRHYEAEGLIETAGRSAGGHRLFDARALDRARFLRHCRELGFPLDAIRELLSLTGRPDRSCAEVDEVARRHLARVEDAIARLVALRTELSRMVDECGGGTVAECRVVEVLRDHHECLADRHPAPEGPRGL